MDTLVAAAKLDVCAPLSAKGKACARAAADALKVELVPLGNPHALTDEDVALAVSIAREYLDKAQGEAGEALFILDALLGAWPPDAARAGADCAARAATSARTFELLTGLAASARMALVCARVAEAAHRRDLTSEAESATRVDAEATHLATLLKAVTRTGRLEARARQFRIIAELSGVPSSAGVRELVQDLLETPRSPACSVAMFNAFPGAYAMPEIAAARAAELTRAGPVQVGAPVEVAGLPAWTGATLSASLSSCGVLCMGGFTNVLTVVHLPSRRAVMISCFTEFTHGFVYSGELFVARFSYDALWHAPVEAVLAGHTDITKFEQMPLAAGWECFPCMYAAPRGRVVVCNVSNNKQHLIVDLAARTSHVVDVGDELVSIGEIAGVEVPDVAYLTVDSSETAFAMALDGTRTEVAHGIKSLPILLPSASAAHDLSRAAVLNATGTVHIGGAHVELPRAVRPAYHSFIRLHRDVFLYWDIPRGTWLAVRVVVP